MLYNRSWGKVKRKVKTEAGRKSQAERRRGKGEGEAGRGRGKGKGEGKRGEGKLVDVCMPTFAISELQTHLRIIKRRVA